MPSFIKSIKPSSYIKWGVVALIIGAIAFFGYQHLNPQPKPPEYLTAEAKIDDIENTVLASGKIEAVESVNVGAQVSGKITKLYVKVGDEVKKGDLIAQISEVEQKNTVSNAQATLNQAKASLTQAEATLKTNEGNINSAVSTQKVRQAEFAKAQKSFARMEQLIKIDAVSRQEYDDAKANLDVAKANLDAATIAIENAKNDVANARANILSQKAAIVKAENDLNTATEGLGYTTITAPMDGTIISVSQEQGTTVNALQSAPTIVTMANLNQVRIKVQISEADVVHVQKGMKTRFNIIGDPDVSYDAILSGVEPAATTSSSSSGESAVYYIGYFDVDNVERKFRLNMTTQANIVIDSVKNVLTIPSAALKQNGKTYTVQVVGQDGFAKPVEVSVGLNNRINAQITQGLNVGDKVVISDSTQAENNKSKRAEGPMM